MNLRSGCERSNSAKKIAHKFDQRPCRSEIHVLVRLYLISMVEHAKAWLSEDRKVMGASWEERLHLEKIEALSNNVA
ncbi:MAG: hypothetical protein HY731_02310 [Candidatus Tectomicrobia bacterium]|nr:hypothetical protein [Candidatus Tectomicrobia bacterium]